jgi:type I restriction enzyme R subunit
MVKHAADEAAPLLTAAERVERAFEKVTAGNTFTPEQEQWLGRIREHLRENLSLDRDDFDLIPIFANHGGLAVVRRIFPKLDDLIHDLNEAMAA